MIKSCNVRKLRRVNISTGKSRFISFAVVSHSWFATRNYVIVDSFFFKRSNNYVGLELTFFQLLHVNRIQKFVSRSCVIPQAHVWIFDKKTLQKFGQSCAHEKSQCLCVTHLGSELILQLWFLPNYLLVQVLLRFLSARGARLERCPEFKQRKKITP